MSTAAADDSAWEAVLTVTLPAGTAKVRVAQRAAEVSNLLVDIRSSGDDCMFVPAGHAEGDHEIGLEILTEGFGVPLTLNPPETVESLRAERDTARTKLAHAECVIRDYYAALNAVRDEREKAKSDAHRFNHRFEAEQEELVTALDELSAANDTIDRLRVTHADTQTDLHKANAEIYRLRAAAPVAETDWARSKPGAPDTAAHGTPTLTEWKCPSCGETTRARMADQDATLTPVGEHPEPGTRGLLPLVSTGVEWRTDDGDAPIYICGVRARLASAVLADPRPDGAM